MISSSLLSSSGLKWERQALSTASFLAFGGRRWSRRMVAPMLEVRTIICFFLLLLSFFCKKK